MARFIPASGLGETFLRITSIAASTCSSATPISKVVNRAEKNHRWMRCALLEPAHD